MHVSFAKTGQVCVDVGLEQSSSSPPSVQSSGRMLALRAMLQLFSSACRYQHPCACQSAKKPRAPCPQVQTGSLAQAHKRRGEGGGGVAAAARRCARDPLLSGAATPLSARAHGQLMHKRREGTRTVTMLLLKSVSDIRTGRHASSPLQEV